uniref:Uncharacterized protein n=1 Tax=Oryza barthii TaxID=65489 RepID=A0A0D3FL91_9ORYZ
MLGDDVVVVIDSGHSIAGETPTSRPPQSPGSAPAPRWLQLRAYRIRSGNGAAMEEADVGPCCSGWGTAPGDEEHRRARNHPSKTKLGEDELVASKKASSFVVTASMSAVEALKDQARGCAGHRHAVPVSLSSQTAGNGVPSVLPRRCRRRMRQGHQAKEVGGEDAEWVSPRLLGT